MSQHDHDLASALRTIRDQDRSKGKAVARQTALWDALLDARIRLQKAVSAMNEADPSLRTSEGTEASLHGMLNESVALCDELFALQESLLRSDGSVAPPPSKRLKVQQEGHQDGQQAHAAQLDQLSSTASSLEAAYHPYLVQTLSKWSAKIQAVAPSVLLSASRASFNARAQDHPTSAGVVDVIQQVLSADENKLLERTRSFKNQAARGEDEETANHNVFDDTDFYQQLLRDVIESRGHNTEEGAQEWVRQQKARKAKRKATVDTKASKGRKLRFDVHDKLQHFMVPVPTQSNWHDDQIDELFSSLSGLTRIDDGVIV